MTPTKVFLDSSVVICGLASDKGGSFEVLALSELGILIPYISEDIVREVFRNVQKKLPSQVDRYHTLIKALSMKLVEPTTENVQYANTLINAKDAPILAAAMSAKVDWLLSMDKHFLTGDFTRKLPFAIGKPGDFLVQLGDKE